MIMLSEYEQQCNVRNRWNHLPVPPKATEEDDEPVRLEERRDYAAVLCLL